MTLYSDRGLAQYDPDCTRTAGRGVWDWADSQCESVDKRQRSTGPWPSFTRRGLSEGLRPAGTVCQWSVDQSVHLYKKKTLVVIFGLIRLPRRVVLLKYLLASLIKYPVCMYKFAVKLQFTVSWNTVYKLTVCITLNFIWVVKRKWGHEDMYYCNRLFVGNYDVFQQCCWFEMNKTGFHWIL